MTKVDLKALEALLLDWDRVAAGMNAAYNASPILIAALRIAVEALREIGGWDDTWSHRGHEPSEVGHECRMCWIMKTKSKALAQIAALVTVEGDAK